MVGEPETMQKRVSGRSAGELHSASSHFSQAHYFCHFSDPGSLESWLNLLKVAVDMERA
jgi:hypothetical protein